MTIPCHILALSAPFAGLPTVVQVERTDTGERCLYLADDRDLSVLTVGLATGQTANIPADQPLIPVSALAMLARGSRQGNVTHQQEEVMSTRERLEYLRGEIRAERISYGEIAELQDLAAEIDPDDVELLEWAGVPEHDDQED